MMPRLRFAVALALATAPLVFAACAKEGSAPGAQEPATPAPAKTAWRSPLDDMKKCTADAECPVDQTCQGKIRAACETCEGGEVVQVCDAPDPCADDSNCTAPRRCQNGGCR